MALADLSELEQRYLAVREVLDTGATVTDVAARHGIDRRTLHRWLVRYANQGIGALPEKSSKPDTCPLQLSAVIEARIIAMRTLHPGWGPRTILTKLRQEFDQVPSRSGIYRCLVRHRLIEPKARRRQRKDYKRWERSRSMELWQMDVVGRIYLSDGTAVSAVTGIDDHSRFCVIAKLVVRATARPVCDALLEGFSRHGILIAVVIPTTCTGTSEVPAVDPLPSAPDELFPQQSTAPVDKTTLRSSQRFPASTACP
jgi:transposase-like protein